MSALLRLYPAAWRERYEEEFLGILASRPPSGRDRLDIVRGAVDARLHPEVPGRPAVPERAAPATWAGAAAVLAGLGTLACTGLTLRDFKGWGAGEPENAALGGLLWAITFLSLAAAHGLLVAAGGPSMRRAGAPVASVASVSFLFAAAGGGLVIGVGLVASIVLATAMAGRTVSWWLAAMWIGASLLHLGAMLAFVAGGGRNVSLLGLMAPVGLVWLVIGLTALRGGVSGSATAPRTLGIDPRTGRHQHVDGP